MAHQSAKRIDIHNAASSYETALARFERDSNVHAANKELILRFLRDCHLGKTVFGRQKKRIQPRRLLKYLYLLRRISYWLGNKDFRSVSQDDVERFIERVDGNRLSFPNESREARPVSYAAWTRRDIKVCLKKFYKWLLGDGRQYPDLVSWIETCIDMETPPSLALDEVRRCVELASSIKGKALLWTLFETGARADEFLNIRLEHVTDKGTRSAIWIEYPKTFRRSLPIFEGHRHLQMWLDVHPDKRNPEAQLFPMTYGALAKYISRTGTRVLKKRVTPHLFRHSFATWLASKKVGRYQMCKLMGWEMSSDMPDRYIDRIGVAEEEAVQAIRGDELSKAEQENSQLRTVLTRFEAECADLRSKLEKREQWDEVLNEAFRDDEVLKVVVSRLRGRK